MSAWPWALLVLWPLPALGMVVLWLKATEPTGYECGSCRWQTGMRPALSAWCRCRWHVRVTRQLLGRCPHPQQDPR